jgi:hypothetical protein
LADVELAQFATWMETSTPMARATLSELRTLRMKYKVAYEAYQSCVRAGTKGEKASADLLEQETVALRQLTETRARLLAAMADG